VLRLARGESEVGAQADPGRVGSTRASARCLDRVGDLECGGRGAGAASLWPDLARVPHRPGRGHHRDRLSSTSTPRSASGCTRWRSSSTASGACAPPASPRIPRGSRPCSRRGISPPTSGTHGVPALVIRDRDAKYGEAFDAVFPAEELDVIKSALRAPRMNAHCERVIGSIRREVLDHVLVMGQAHARQVLAAYRLHHNEHRPHQARNQLPPDAQQQPAAVHGLGTRRLLRTRILGGLMWYGSFRGQTVRVVLVRDNKPRIKDRDEPGLRTPAGPHRPDIFGRRPRHPLRIPVVHRGRVLRRPPDTG
jgi:putative transposase